MIKKMKCLSWKAKVEMKGSPSGTPKQIITIMDQTMKMMEDKLIAVSDPRSPAYGKHLTKEQVSMLAAAWHHAACSIPLPFIIDLACFWMHPRVDA